MPTAEGALPSCNLYVTNGITKRGFTGYVNTCKVEVGQTGMTSSRLAPMGKALINNQYYEVHSTGAFIDQNEEIIVVKVEGLSIFVKLKKE